MKTDARQGSFAFDAVEEAPIVSPPPSASLDIRGIIADTPLAVKGVKPQSRKKPVLWTPPPDLFLPDMPQEAAAFQKEAREAWENNGTMDSLAKFISLRGVYPPLSGLLALIRKVSGRIPIGKFNIVDANAAALLGFCLAHMTRSAYSVTYRDADVEKFTNCLVPSRKEADGLMHIQNPDFILRPCPMEQESIGDFVKLVSGVAPGGIVLAYVAALSFMDASPGDNDGEAKEYRERIFANFELLGAVRYASDPHDHGTHLDLLVMRRYCPQEPRREKYTTTGTGYMPWQRANEFYVQQPGLIFDSRSLFSEAASRLL